jgi:Cu(I)/Ag(I) efflux system membrane fusion protein/cobalt-zinc-cadmium efflux system membrane fusion protein
MEHRHKMGMGKDMHHEMRMEGEMNSHKGMEMDSSKSNEQSIAREGVIDLKAIDKNKDGKVYQDVMDWNVISDEPGKCPICGMKLKEVTLEKAKENLIKNDFKVK